MSTFFSTLHPLHRQGYNSETNVLLFSVADPEPDPARKDPKLLAGSDPDPK